MDAAWDVNLAKANELYARAIEEDPDFFLPYYQMAIYDLYFGNMESFREHAEKAVVIEAKLSPGEELLQEALGKWLEDPKADITETGNELVEMYPNDELAYGFLAFCQYIAGNHEGQIETYKQALEIAEHQGAIYNSLGYAYMNLENLEEAENAFDTYIEMEPNKPNPYDSKGDYFMAVEDYEKAAEQFMKAYEIDTTWKVSYNKALKAKSILDSLQTE
jgi:predicted Zn-dependent protease